jgi:hypothetical protein
MKLRCPEYQCHDPACGEGCKYLRGPIPREPASSPAPVAPLEGEDAAHCSEPGRRAETDRQNAGLSAHDALLLQRLRDPSLARVYGVAGQRTCNEAADLIERLARAPAQVPSCAECGANLECSYDHHHRGFDAPQAERAPQNDKAAPEVMAISKRLNDAGWTLTPAAIMAVLEATAPPAEGSE